LDAAAAAFAAAVAVAAFLLQNRIVSLETNTSGHFGYIKKSSWMQKEFSKRQQGFLTTC
jgi:hypothetical protein